MVSGYVASVPERRKMKTTVKIHNLPEHPNKLVVARVVDGELWYYGSFDSEDRAEYSKKEVDGIIAEVTDDNEGKS